MEYVKRLLQSDYLILALCAVLVLVAAPATPGFATSRNIVNVLSVAAPLLIVALGQMLVMISGGIDLSVTAVLAITSVAGASLVTSEGGPLVGDRIGVLAVLLAMPLLGSLCGAVNGLSVAWLKLPPFIATLTSMMFLYGLATWWTQSEYIAGLPEQWIQLGTNNGVTLVVTLLAAGVVAWGLRETIYGRWLYAVGQNQQTSLVSGVPVAGVIFAAYLLSGLLAGTASTIYTAQLETGSPVLGENLLLDVIGAVVIGGTSLFGGKGKVSWTIGGVLFIALLDNVLNLRSLSHFSVMIAKGTLILLAALLDALRHRWSAA